MRYRRDMCRYIRKICILAAALLIPAVNISADVNQDVSALTSVTDYYMVVESPNGGIDFYSYPDLDSEKPNGKPIHNGTAFHIQGSGA